MCLPSRSNTNLSYQTSTCSSRAAVTMLSMRIPRAHWPQASGGPRDFAPFPRLPVELRVMIWEFASHEQGYLQVVQWKTENMFHPDNHQSHNEFHNPDEDFPVMKKRFSPLLLVNREAHAVVKPSHFLMKLLPSGEFHYSPSVSYADDMFYFPNAPQIAKLLSAIIGEPFANKLERVAIPVLGTPYFDNDYVSGQQFEDAIKSLPKLRQLFLVVDKLFSFNFGPGRVARNLLPYQRCPHHVASRTALREYVQDQYDCGFGFSSYKLFTQRWQMPMMTPFDAEKASFEDYDAYCHRVVARVRQIADKLGRYIDVKLRVDLDGQTWVGQYSRNDTNFADLPVETWYESMVGKHRYYSLGR